MKSNFTTLFKVFALCLTNGTENSKSQRFLQAICGIYIIFTICMLVFQLLVRNAIYYNYEIVGQICDIVPGMLPTLTHLLILMQSFSKVKVHRKLNKTIKSIRVLLADILKVGSQNESFLRKNLINYFLALNGICMLSEIIIISIPKERKWTYNIIVKTFPLIVNRLSDFQFLFYVIQIKFAIRMINQKLGKARGLTRHLKIKRIKLVLNKIWRTSDLLNMRFGFSLLWTVTTNFLVLLTSCYWISYKFYSGGYSSVSYEVASLLFVVSPVVNLSIMFFTCSSCIKEVNSIVFKNHPQLRKNIFTSLRKLDAICTISSKVQ